MTSRQPLVLASSSIFRRELLDRLKLDYQCISPDIDESPLEQESPGDLALRLALAKAKKGAESFPEALIIGSDQVTVIDGKVTGKPGNHDNAVKQLIDSSGKTLKFLTSICLFNAVTGDYQLELVPYKVTFRTLSEDVIEYYLKTEQPYQCAGAFKSEGLGISLISKMEGSDPNALIGLPLITLTSMLEAEGQAVLKVAD